ncbi:hypothetical protein, partial [Aeromonas veronii]
ALITGQYSEKNIPFSERLARRSFHTYVYFLLMGFAYLFFSHQAYISRLFTTVVLIGFTMALFFNRFLYALICGYYKR